MNPNPARPISPHLQVYKLPLTGIISITHRMTGVMLSLGLVMMVYMLTALAGGVGSYNAMQALMGNVLVRLVLWGFTFALFFHLCHGVRHLIWDAGQTFDRDTLNRYAVLELIASAALTLIAFIWGCYAL